jgi:N-hydroxyarylamine O-acetyltransferase
VVDSHPFDIQSYLGRVGCTGVQGTDLAVLQELHAAHVAAIPFENLDVVLGRPILLDMRSLQEKIVRGGRGGYCFEQNTLFAGALRALGFRVLTLEARVRPPGAAQILPRTHMVLQVDLHGSAWLADVGFGVDGPIYPVPFQEALSEQPGAHIAWCRKRQDGFCRCAIATDGRTFTPSRRCPLTPSTLRLPTTLPQPTQAPPS